MRKLTYEELYGKIKLHDHWLISNGSEGQQLDLLSYDLSGLAFELPRSLIRIKLNNCNLKKTYLVSADLTEGSFNETDFTEAVLVDAEFTCASLVKSKLHQIDGKNASFLRADLRDADFTQAYLLAAGFSYANLQYTNFTEAHLWHAVFRETDLRHAIFQNADINDVFFSGTRCFGVNLHNAKNIETVRVEWIDIGEDEPIRLEGEAAREWLMQATKEGPQG